ncbi:hypothetical protein [Streptomyces sp. NRRL F-5126]|uniref:hypothetical protein n=1 Tax=Streptomyces sp. NRRL F-5126 TaxID=1463857 RepID=UPI0004C4A95C|nr:hypothetical protein [Streptomyces sp. NRRL F-5126]
MDVLWFVFAFVLLAAPVGLLMRLRRVAASEAVRGSVESADPEAYGFVPREELDVRLPGPDEDLLHVIDVVQGTRRWQPAARLLAGTPERGEARWQRVQGFAGAACLELTARPGRGAGADWLREWRADAPDDAGAAEVFAEFLVQQAWRTARPGTDEFRIILEEARTVSEEAAMLAPRDPVPYMIELAVARGLGYGRERFERLWAEVVDRAPAHMGAHLAALRYFTARWHGSRKDAVAFATAAAARAPRGSLLAALPLFAVYEHLPRPGLGRSRYRGEAVRRAVAGAVFAVREAAADDPVVPHVRHLLVLFLVRMSRWREAMEQLLLVDGHVGAVPWTYARDPAAAYAAHRARAVAGYEASGGSPATLRG